MASSTSVAVFLSTVMLVLLCGTVHQCVATRCTCPPHYFDTYAGSATRAQLVGDGIQSELFMMGNNQSQLLPHTPSDFVFGGEPAFRIALNTIAVLYEVTSSSDIPLLDGTGDVNNDILRGILGGLTSDACNWIRGVIPASDITCNVESLRKLHKSLSIHENVVAARDSVPTVTGSVGGDFLNQRATNRCAWINNRILGDCRPICTSEGAIAQSDTVRYYDDKFKCSGLRNTVEDLAGDYALCSNTL